MNEQHDLEVCECRECAIKQRDIAISMLAEWCVAIVDTGSNWDDWDYHYKKALWGDCPLRKRLDKEILSLTESEWLKDVILEKNNPPV